MSIQIVGDVVSQPVRATWALCLCNPEKIKDWKRVDIRLSKAENKTKEMMEKNPSGKVPFMIEVGEDGRENLRLFESHTILKYICAKYSLPDHWYPTSPNRDIILQARMDVYLDWHHAGLRLGVTGYLVRAHFSGLLLPSKQWAT